MIEDQRAAIEHQVNMLRRPVSEVPTMDAISAAELAQLESCKSEVEWHTACVDIKGARGGEYPSDWFAKVNLSGLMHRVSSRW
jgi:hypothetical protein